MFIWGFLISPSFYRKIILLDREFLVDRSVFPPFLNFEYIGQLSVSEVSLRNLLIILLRLSCMGQVASLLLYDSLFCLWHHLFDFTVPQCAYVWVHSVWSSWLLDVYMHTFLSQAWEILDRISSNNLCPLPPCREQKYTQKCVCWFTFHLISHNSLGYVHYSSQSFFFLFLRPQCSVYPISQIIIHSYTCSILPLSPHRSKFLHFSNYAFGSRIAFLIYF